jgi:HTH-type transcriptional regulator/antitoxin MqsA
MKKLQCPLCGEFQQEHKVKPMTYTYKGFDFVIDQPAMWCDACGEGIIDAKDNNTVMPLILEKKAQIDGLLTPEEIRQVRVKLKLTQKQAAAIFGGGVNAFNRYERGKLPIPRPLSLLLTVLRNHPSQLQELIRSDEHRAHFIY